MDGGGGGDSSVRAPEAQKSALLLIGGVGGVSILLNIAAEIGASPKRVVDDADKGPYCVYPEGSPTTYLAVSAAAALLLALGVAFASGSLAWTRGLISSLKQPAPRQEREEQLQEHSQQQQQEEEHITQQLTQGLSGHTSNTRSLIIVVLVTELVFLIAAVWTSVSAASEASGVVDCDGVRGGAFLTAAVLSLFAVVLLEVYYVLSMRWQQELWLHAYSTPQEVDMEAFSRAATTQRTVASQRDGDGGVSGEGDGLSE